MFQRFFDEGLAQASYLIACPRTREAAVVDPRRDIDIYVAAARQQGLALVYAIETHVHADFVSGGRELAQIGARVVAGPGAGLAYPHHAGRDRERIALGDISLELLHTPGHTPEHISVLVHEPNQPARLLSGDTLFVGGVGRPDLLGDDQARQLAHQLFDSLFETLLTLDDATEVHPGHGAGSLCGTGIGKEPFSTIGQERRVNPMLQHASKESFVSAVLGDLPETPPYFARMKRLNQRGPAVLNLSGPVEAPGAISPLEAFAVSKNGGVLVDLRTADEFGKGHPSGAMHIAYGSKVGYWAGWVLPPGVQIVLIADAAADRSRQQQQTAAVRRQLLRVGFDTVAGVVEGGFGAWQSIDLPVSRITQMSAAELHARLDRSERPQVVDVRTRREWQGGHIDGAVNVPVGDLPQRASELPRDAAVAVICEGGFRSSLASSLLERAGMKDIINVTDGMAAFRAAELTR
jgi:hydroxyacylglutathione hydrolase